jgi:hypothetical protein
MRTITLVCAVLLSSVCQARQSATLPPLKVGDFKVGQSYEVENVYGKVLYVKGNEGALVGIDNGEEKGKARYATVVWCKFPTRFKAGHTALLSEIIGAGKVVVGEPQRFYYRSKGKTVSDKVFVLKPYDATPRK